MELTDNDKMLAVLCALDHRLISDTEELYEIALLFPVKREMWYARKRPMGKMPPGEVYEMIRREAVTQARDGQIGVTTKVLCQRIYDLIQRGPRWLGIESYTRTYNPDTYKQPRPTPWIL